MKGNVTKNRRCHRGRDRVVYVVVFKIIVQSVPITTKFVSSNHTNMTFCDKVCHDMTEILLKEGLNIITSNSCSKNS